MATNLWYVYISTRRVFAHYHKRSNVETVFHMIKSKSSGNIKSKNKTAYINEVLLKVLCHNICVLIEQMFELGIKPEFSNGA